MVGKCKKGKPAGGLRISGWCGMLAGGMIVDVLRFASLAGLPGLAAWLDQGYERGGLPPARGERLERPERLLSQFADDLEGVL
jgi:hypothetical protein